MAADLPADVDERVDALYGLEPAAFVPARDALSREVRATGSREQATAVAKLPRPSLPAWAVNQVVRTQRPAAQRLWAAGDAVADAQRRVLAGEAGAAELRDAVEAEREALAPLGQAARGLMTAPGRFLAEGAVQQVLETLHAAALDPTVRADVARGRIARPVRMAGMGPVAEREAAPEAPRVDDAAEQARQAEARRALAKAERDATAARKRLRTAEHALERAEEAVAARRADVQRAEEAVDAARREAERTAGP
jgi:hypothetical protein